jgi:hypothetical protein
MVLSLALIAAFVATTFLVVPLAVFAASSRWLRETEESRISFACLVIPIAPLVLAALLAFLYSFGIAGRPPVTIAIVLVLAACALALGRAELAALWKELRAVGRIQRSGSRLFLAFLGGLLACVVLQALTMPLMENDAIEYLAVSRHIFERGTLAAYPLTEANERGLFMPASHPPAYHMVLVWGYAWFGTANFLPVRLLSLFVLFGFVLLFSHGLRRSPRASVTIAIALLICTPLFVSMLVGYHIDSLRLLAFLSGALGVARLIDHPGPRSAMVAGLGLAFAAFAHSIGVLAVVFGGLTWLLLGPKGRFSDWRTPLIVGAVVLLVGGWHYIRNMLIFGVPLHDSLPVWEMPELDFATELRYRRDLIVPADRLVFGVFRSFTELPLFGLLFWLMLAVVWFGRKHWSAAPTSLRVAVVWVAGYFAVALATAAIGSELVIKNARYAMTMVPLAVLIVAPVLAWVLGRLRWNNWLVILLILLLPGWMMIQSLWRISHFAARPDIYTLGERAPIYRSNERFPGAEAFRYLEANLKPGEKTFVFRQPDFTLYGTGNWIDNFDDRLMEFYRLSDADAGVAWLKARGVRYMLLPWYFFPTVSQTIVGEMIGDERRTELVVTARGYSLYRLRDEPPAAICTPVPDQQVEVAFLLEQRTLIGSVVETAGIPIPLSLTHGALIGGIELSDLNARPEGTRALEIAAGHKNFISVATWSGDPALPPLSPYAQINPGDGPIAFSASISGEGLNAIEVVQYVQVGRTLEARATRLWEGRAFAQTRRITARFKPDNAALAFRFVIRKPARAASTLRVDDMSICRTSALRVRPDKKAPETPPLIVWSPEKLTSICTAATDPDCRQTFVRGILPHESESWPSFAILSTDGRDAGWRFRLRSYTETWRIFAETYPDATTVQLFRPVLGLVSAEAPKGWENYLVAIAGSGMGAMTLYAQYSMPDGRVDWRYIERDVFGEKPREITFPLQLPVGARDIQLVLVLNHDSYVKPDRALITSLKLFRQP